MRRNPKRLAKSEKEIGKDRMKTKGNGTGKRQKKMEQHARKTKFISRLQPAAKF